MEPYSISVEAVGPVDYIPSKNDYTIKDGLFQHIQLHYSECVITFEPLNMNSTPRTLTYFIDHEQQPLYIANVPIGVKFMVFIYCTNDSFKITQFERLVEPTAQFNQKTSILLEYGVQWNLFDVFEQRNKKCIVQ
ncbi:MAG: hypothetical protein EZS28_002379 [Streblomastix strix]|uniref:Uncharacterized protein n=1 Tax=Streblomastix strix TaxID=222440 RepID=A0A5J4X537_9EUKA|nr:MAG: hypothetical protein EZS28_002379 [Streblomastix strix]